MIFVTNFIFVDNAHNRSFNQYVMGHQHLFAHSFPSEREKVPVSWQVAPSQLRSIILKVVDMNTVRSQTQGTLLHQQILVSI